MNAYGINNLIRLAVQFNDLITSEAIDPTAVVLYVKSPDGSVQEFTYAANQIIRDALGQYHYDLENTEVGYYNYRYEGSGNIIAASNSQFQSVASPFGTL